MSKKEDIQKTEENLEEVEKALTSAERFIEKNQRSITFSFGGAILVAVLILVFVRFYQEPREATAKEQSFVAEQYFQKDSFELALNGDGNYQGFLDIVNDYSGTKAGNLANYYAGISYLHLGEYQNAIDYLNDFSTDDMLVAPVAMGAKGDANLELGNKTEAISLYLDAAKMNDNKMTSPYFLMKAGKVYESLDRKSEALEVYTIIKNDFKGSAEASSIDKFIARVSN